MQSLTRVCFDCTHGASLLCLLICCSPACVASPCATAVPFAVRSLPKLCRRNCITAWRHTWYCVAPGVRQHMPCTSQLATPASYTWLHAPSHALSHPTCPPYMQRKVIRSSVCRAPHINHTLAASWATVMRLCPLAGAQRPGPSTTTTGDPPAGGHSTTARNACVHKLATACSAGRGACRVTP